MVTVGPASSMVATEKEADEEELFGFFNDRVFVDLVYVTYYKLNEVIIVHQLFFQWMNRKHLWKNQPHTINHTSNHVIELLICKRNIYYDRLINSSILSSF